MRPIEIFFVATSAVLEWFTARFQLVLIRAKDSPVLTVLSRLPLVEAIFS